MNSVLIWVIIGAFVPGFLISWLGGFVVRRLAPPLGWVDRPGGRKIHAQPMPTAGGVAIWLGVVLPLALGYAVLWNLREWGENATAEIFGTVLPAEVVRHFPGLLAQASKLWLMLVGGTILAFVGLLDDRWGLDWRLRLGIQTAVAVAMVALDWRLSLFLPWPALAAGISVLWIVALVNSFNMLDNMDGLAAGVAAIAAGMLAAVMFMAGKPGSAEPQLFVGGFLVLVVGASLGFLAHNFPPARLFMGDAGSYWLGYLLAMTTMAATFAGENLPPHAILAPLCVLAIPLYDLTTVVAIRLWLGQSPFVGDRRHFSHRLEELGLTRTQAVLTIWLATATCGLGALLLHQVRPSGAIIILLLVVMMLILMSILETVGRSRNPSNRTPRDSPGGGDQSC